ncbi:MAG: T9SS type A sorting domain-containing protein [Saprospiraceae bacterium]|nr:T9SS type A sorting domain-containing protein [Saprospiraceae bacterium]
MGVTEIKDIINLATVGRYVSIVVDHSTASNLSATNPLTLSEVKVYGCSSSGAFSVEIPESQKASISNTDEKVQVILYPNPVINTLYLKFKNQDLHAKEISIVDIYGRLILLQNNAQNYISISSLEKGTYFAKIVVEDNIVIKKFIKN